MALFHSFLWLNSAPFCVYHTFFIHPFVFGFFCCCSSIDGHFGCFHVLAIWRGLYEHRGATKSYFIFKIWLHHTAYGISVPQPRTEPRPSPRQWKDQVLTGPPGNSHESYFYYKLAIIRKWEEFPILISTQLNHSTNKLNETRENFKKEM